MNDLARKIQRTYLTLMFGNTLAASFIWGINTLFLLDAGLSNFEAFAANAFFTVGMVLFEIPTGIIADTWGRRASYLLGTITLSATTAMYYLLWLSHSPFVLWALVSALLGLGFTFFSGALEAWLVDAMQFAKYEGGMEQVFGKGQVATGVAMLSGSVAGGVVAQATSLGVPFILRAAVLVLLFAFAFYFMRDMGFTPDRTARPLKAMRSLLDASLEHGLKNPPVRWVMLAAPFSASVGFYAFYALQPYMLQLYGNEQAYSIAGLVAAVFAGAQIAGGILAGKIRGLFKRRTTAMIVGNLVAVTMLISIGLNSHFLLAVLLLIIWGLFFAAVMPIRQAYLNALIPSRQRATVLSFDSMIANTGGVIVQPGLGKVADAHSYGTSFVVGGLIQLCALPLLLRARQIDVPADKKET